MQLLTITAAPIPRLSTIGINITDAIMQHTMYDVFCNKQNILVMEQLIYFYFNDSRKLSCSGGLLFYVCHDETIRSIEQILVFVSNLIKVRSINCPIQTLHVEYYNPISTFCSQTSELSDQPTKNVIKKKNPEHSEKVIQTNVEFGVVRSYI